MHEILQQLGPGKRVLDLGARAGSFDADPARAALVVRLDLDPPPLANGVSAVQADASALPFRDESFDIIIANHSLEHITELARALDEIGRVVRPTGAVYIAVPDSTTLSDRLYRWVYHGGGHVNPFRSPEEVDEHIRRHVPLSSKGWRNLHTSFGFLEGRHFRPRPPRRMWVLANGHYAAVVMLGYLARMLDRLLGTRLSLYGWALYYGSTGVDPEVWTNVCVRCGNAQPAALLPTETLVWPIRWYRCPACGGWNLFSPDPPSGMRQ